MKSYQNMLNKLCDIITTQQLDYKDTIIIGDNSSGKSELLKQLIENDKDEQFYFIDAVNRYFDINQILEKDENIVYSKEINKKRLEEDHFNRKDSFYYGGIPKAIEDFYLCYEDKLKILMNEFLKIQFDIIMGKIGWEVFINDEKVELSSGYQALLRIFMEVLYFADTRTTGIIVIDEIDEFLSVKNSGKILGFLRKKFSKLNFIVTTHSADLIANSENINLILLHNDTFEMVDAGDFSSVSQVYDIFNALFGKQEQTEKEKTDETLRILFNNRMSGIWGLDENNTLEQIKMQHLTKAQKLIVRQIEEWQI